MNMRRELVLVSQSSGLLQKQQITVDSQSRVMYGVSEFCSLNWLHMVDFHIQVSSYLINKKDKLLNFCDLQV